MKAPALIALAIPVLLAGCATGPSAEEQVAMAAEARKASGALIQKLGGELKTALGEKGPDGAIGVCKERAPQIAAEVSKQSGFDVKRVSPKNRNPAGVPDAWEAEAQAGLEKRMAAGEKPETLDTWQIVSTSNGKQFRYAKALPVQPVCLTCHGDAAAIPDTVKARLAAEYPHDKATGYGPGMVRGIISIKRSL
ncbi:MAG: Tll0287-like domain-containing protein [Thiobacillus sp.]